MMTSRTGPGARRRVHFVGNRTGRYWVPALLLLVAAAVVRSHPDDPKLLDRMAPFAGPVYRASGPGPNPLASTTFESDGVRLMAWFPLNNFPGAPTSGNDCWSHVSPSGREYALVGLSNGVGVVDVTVPAASQIVAHVPGPESFLRDIKTYGEYAYVVSEGGGGIQVLDLTDIDAGNVTIATTVDDIQPATTHNVAIDTDSGYLYRCGGDTRGIRVYSLANPDSPVFVASWDDRYVHDAQIVTFTSGPLAGRQIAYCCTGFDFGFTQTGITILDVTDKQNIFVLSQTYYDDARYSHQAWLSEDRMYLFHGDELDEPELGVPTTTRVFDVSDPASVTLATTFASANTSGGHNMYTHGDLLYQANFRSGLRILDVSDPLAPVETAWFDTFPDDDGPQLNGLWSCDPTLPSGTILGSDIERGLFVWRRGSPIAIALRGQIPETLDPNGSAIRLDIVENEGVVLAPGGANLHYDIGEGIETAPLVEVGPGIYDAVFPPIPCGTEILFWISALGDDGIEAVEPAGAPAVTYRSLSAAFLDTPFRDEMEVDTGWMTSDPSDTATAGFWTRVEPIGTIAQPEFDHSPDPGKMCFVTEQGGFDSEPDESDVDGGTATLTTPAFDLSDADEPRVGYHRWYSNSTGAAPGEDTFLVEISNDDGATWTLVESIGPSGPDTEGGWHLHEFDPRGLVALSSTMRVRFVVSDTGADSTVEAGIDDFRAFDILCDADEPLAICGPGRVNAACGAVAEVLTINGSTGGASRILMADQTTPLVFEITEPPVARGDGSSSRAVVYLWTKHPIAGDIITLPGDFGFMCFGPQILTTLNPYFTWNSIGAEAKLGDHDAPGPPPVIADDTTFTLTSIGQGAGRPIRLTVQGIVTDSCSQGVKQISVTNAVALEID